MKVEQLMRRTVETCRPGDSLNRAAQLMWEHDCGSVPVVDDDGRAIGIVTDRDVCMAAYTQGGALAALPVASAMARSLHTCRPGDTIGEAERIMRLAQVRRLPVVDVENRVVGILSLGDLAAEATRELTGRRRRTVRSDVVGETLGAICTPRQPRSLSPAA